MNILYKMRKQLKGSDWPWRSAVVCMWCVVLWCAEPEAAPETVVAVNYIVVENMETGNNI